MQIQLSGHHVEITDGIREAVNSKFSKVQSHYPVLDALQIIVTIERNEQKVEASTLYAGANVSAHASDTDLYVAISETARKLEAALSHRKGATQQHRKEKLSMA